jgi:serine protease inhibitor
MNIMPSFIPRILGRIGLRQSGASLAGHQGPASATKTFAFKLLKQLAKDQPNANIFISPYSASTALQMVANGACGQTKPEMEEVLGGGSVDLSNAISKQTAQSLQSGNPYVILEIANSIWYRKEITVNPKFLACNQEYFGATVAPLDYAAPRSVEIINNWQVKRHMAESRISPMA